MHTSACPHLRQAVGRGVVEPKCGLQLLRMHTTLRRRFASTLQHAPQTGGWERCSGAHMWPAAPVGASWSAGAGKSSSPRRLGRSGARQTPAEA
eukprot:1160247-Pelagomonas_calceolata.AAC.5